jgi:hypothetical protein
MGIGLVALLVSTAVAKDSADYLGFGAFSGDGSRGYSKTDPNYEEYDTSGLTFKAGMSQFSFQSIEASATFLGTKTELNNFVLFLGIDVDYVITPYERQRKFITPFISLGLGSYHFNGDTDNNNTTYDETEGIAFNGKVGFYFKLSRHLELEAHMHGKTFLWNTSENDTGENARREADTMTNYYLGINWHY